MKSLLISIISLLVLAACTSTAAFAEPMPDGDGLRKLVRRWTQDDADLRTVHVAGKHTFWTFRFIWDGEHAACYMTCPPDDSIALASVDDRTIYWDAVHRQAIIVSNSIPRFAVGVADRSKMMVFAGSYGYFLAGEPRSDRYDFLLDLPALMGLALRDTQVESTDPHHFKLSAATDQGSAMTAWFDLKMQQPLRRLHFAHHTADFNVTFDRIEINEPIAAQIPPLPTADQLRKHFKVVEVDRVTSHQHVEALSRRALGTLELRYAVRKDDSVRAKAEAFVGQPIDWDQFATDDKTDADLLRELIRLPQFKPANDSDSKAREGVDRASDSP